MTVWISERACAKVNLALHVLGRREDGYHQLDSIVAFADVSDEVKLRVAKAISLKVTGPFSSSVPTGDENIILKAYKIANEICEAQSVKLPNLEIHLEKNLPVAAGIGGGSADAAAFLRAAMRFAKIAITPQQIQTLATTLGADVPVCFLQKPTRMQGIGEVIVPLTVELPAAIVLVNPLKPCSTQAVFQKLALSKGHSFRAQVKETSAPEWRNDLTESAIAIEPEIKQVLESLQAEPCFSAVRMSGSGATCFGLVASRATANAAAARLAVRNPNWWVQAGSLTKG